MSIEAHSKAPAPLRALSALVGTFVLLIVELALTIATYVGLNLYSFDLFGRLVRFAGGVLEVLTVMLDRVFPASADSAYATLFGELGPKSILLLLIGLVVAAVLRLVLMLTRTLRDG